ncbi:hypothetical protein [Agromyces sp. M3QZ16-3]|uniref:hypothetical protein n=1 Tax=Agromyces sp. M3QZ16-3 TaxID=3447585 RepID=UPI003F6922A5
MMAPDEIRRAIVAKETPRGTLKSSAAYALLDALSDARAAGVLAEEANDLVLGFHRIWKELEAAVDELGRPPASA